MAYGNRGFSTFAGVFEQGNRRIGPAFLEAPPAILREACNVVCRFFRIAFEKLSIHSSFLSLVSGAIYLKKRPFFRLKRRYISENALLFFSSENDNIVKTSNDTPEERKTGLDTSPQKTSSTLRRASLIRSDFRSKIRESTYKTQFRVKFSVFKTLP